MVTPRSPLSQGGVERHVMEVSRRLAAAGAEVEVLCTEPGGPALAEEERDGVEIRTVRAWPANRDWCLAPRIWREMSRRPWDVVHVQSYHTLVAPLAMLRALTLGIPYVVTFHGGGHSSDARNRARRPAAPAAATAAGAGRAPGRRRPLRDRGVRRRARSAAGEVRADPERHRPRLRRDRRQRRRARRRRHRRHDRPARALQGPPPGDRRLPGGAAAEAGGDACCVVGTGPYEDELRRQAEELGIAAAVEFTSTPPDQPTAMAELLGRVSLVVLMSEFETHPLVALEAAAAGCRLLVADASGLGRDRRGRLRPGDPARRESRPRSARAVLEELALPPPSKTPDLTSWDECAATPAGAVPLAGLSPATNVQSGFLDCSSAQAADTGRGALYLRLGSFSSC